MPEQDPFSLDGLRIDPADPDLRPKVATAHRKPKWRKQFVRVPWAWIDRLKDARNLSTYRVALHLLYEYWRGGGRSVVLSNSALKDAGVNRWTKWDALLELERLGLIVIERRPRKSPLVTLLGCEESCRS
jgi:hypothetical protein